VQTTPVFTVRLEPPEKMMVVRVGAPDRRRSEPFEVTAEIENRDERHEVAVTASCVIVEAQRYLPTQEVRVPPRGKVTLRWQSAAGSRPLESGVYTATVSLSEVTGAAGSASFVVK
jgi:hypothetical protein